MVFALKNRPYEASVDQKPTEYEATLTQLDVASSHLLGRMDFICLMGVIGGVKPACDVDYHPGLPPYLDKLGLAYETYAQGDYADGMAISKDPEIAQALASAFSSSRRDDEAFRRIGKMLGYPKTATEYYIERSATMKGESMEDALPMVIPRSLEDTMPSDFHHFILSPDHWREEVDEYIVPLKEAVERLAPVTYGSMERDFKRQKMTRKALGFLGIKQPSLSSELKIPIYQPD